MGVDDREDRMSAYCLLTATYSIEQYCLRRLLGKVHVERLERDGGPLLTLREYPVREVLSVYAPGDGGEANELLLPEWYTVFPELEDETSGGPENIPYTICLSPALHRGWGPGAVKAVYRAGYYSGEVPPDLASACLELAAWYMSRYRGRRIGMTGSVRGSGKDGEHLEASMPENVRALVEPYRRRTM